MDPASLFRLLHPGLVLLAAAVGQSPQKPQKPQTVGEKVATFLQARIGTRVGGGECSHAATEALRQGGGEFVHTDIGADHPAAGDYVWGTQVKLVSCTGGKWADSAPEAKVQVGDVLQCGSATLKSGPITFTTGAHHTSIVATVNKAATLPTQVYEQNVGGVRTLRLSAADLTTLTAGWVRVYRPVVRKDPPGACKFTVVNNMPGVQTVTIKVDGATVSTLDLGVAASGSSFTCRWVVGAATRTLVLANGASLAIQNAGGYEIYAGKDGAAAMRVLTP